MKKRTKDILSIIWAELFALFLFVGAISVLCGRLNSGQQVVTNRYGETVPVEGGIVIIGIVGIIALIYLPKAMWKEKNMTKAERKKRDKQKRKNPSPPKKSSTGWNFPWE